MRLKDKIAVVTGASKAYGMEIAKAFAREGADLAIAARGMERLQKVADEIAAETGRKVLPVQTDVTVKADVENLMQKAVDTYGRIDILVNDVGIYPVATLLDMKEEELDLVLTTNIKGYFLCAQAAAKHMVEKKYGKIVNVSSMQGVVGVALMSHYSATKGAINAATRSWAAELAPYGIRVNAIAYGTFPDEELKQIFPPEFWDNVVENTPIANFLGRIGRTDEVTPPAVFFASPESDWTSGQTLVWDGGRTML
jgi:NAD(P)-dependent dehydrogenase (short-subunit alcohol dehydrogenase family)